MTRVTTNEVLREWVWSITMVTIPVWLMQLLKTLNCNMENPYLIWDNRTRAELTKYLEEQQQSMIRTVGLFLSPSPPPSLSLFSIGMKLEPKWFCY